MDVRTKSSTALKEDGFVPDKLFAALDFKPRSPQATLAYTCSLGFATTGRKRFRPRCYKCPKCKWDFTLKKKWYPGCDTLFLIASDRSSDSELAELSNSGPVP